MWGGRSDVYTGRGGDVGKSREWGEGRASPLVAVMKLGLVASALSVI